MKNIFITRSYSPMKAVRFDFDQRNMKTLLSISLVILSSVADAQILQTGLKAGYVLSWTRHDDHFTDYDDLYRITPVSGFNVGATGIVKIRKRFFLQSEILFTTKGRRLTGRVDKVLTDRATYYHLDVPILYNIHFNGRIKLKNIKVFKWYTGVGPNISYWLGGKGRIVNTEFIENQFPEMDYKIRFGERGEDGAQSNIYMKDINRLQLGIQLGGGILLEPINGKKIMIDARFEFGHTWLGSENSADYIIPLDYNSAKNMKDRNNNIRFSVMYLWEKNLEKRSRKKGKSTLKKQRLG